MKDYAENIIKARKMLATVEACLLLHKHMTAYESALSSMRELEELMEYCLDKEREESEADQQARFTPDIY